MSHVKDLEGWELQAISEQAELTRFMQVLAERSGQSLEDVIYKSICKAVTGDSEKNLSQEFLAHMAETKPDNCVPRFSRVH